MFPLDTTTKITVVARTDSAIAPVVCRLNAVKLGYVKLDWFRSWPHVSTIYSSVANFEKIDHIYYKRHLIEHKDGGNNALDFAIRSDEHLSEEQYETSGDAGLPARTCFMSPEETKDIGSQSDGVLYLAVHGLSGGSHEHYIRRTITELFEAFPDGDQVNVVAFNARGCARSKVTSGVYWSAMQSDDLEVAIEFLHKIYPNKKIVAAGYSLGANILVNYLARVGTASKVHLALSVSNPWNLWASNVNLESTWLGRLYSRKMTQGLQRLFKRNAAVLLREGDGIDKNEVLAAQSLREFDEAFTAKHFNFESAKHYYVTASSGRVVSDIKTNLIVLNAKDDPMALNPVLPYEQTMANDQICMILTENGGHIGWYASNNKRWFADIVVQSVEKVLGKEL